MMKNKSIPDLYLEQILLDELPESKKKQLNMQDLDEVVESLRESDREILLKYSPEDMAGKLQARLSGESEDANVSQGPSSWFNRQRAGILIAAAAVAIIAGMSPFLFRQDPDLNPLVPDYSTTRIKGLEPSIVLYRKVSGSVEQLGNNAKASENDLLQIKYNAGGKLFGVIFSIDGRGVVTLHYPADKSGSLVLTRDGEVALDFSYQLDDAPRFERFFFITSDRTFNIDTVLTAGWNLADKLVRDDVDLNKSKLDLPAELDQISMILQKEVSK
jgi:hypothetical protein